MFQLPTRVDSNLLFVSFKKLSFDMRRCRCCCMSKDSRSNPAPPPHLVKFLIFLKYLSVSQICNYTQTVFHYKRARPHTLSLSHAITHCIYQYPTVIQIFNYTKQLVMPHAHTLYFAHTFTCNYTLHIPSDPAIFTLEPIWNAPLNTSAYRLLWTANFWHN